VRASEKSSIITNKKATRFPSTNMNPVRYTQVPQEVLQNENFYIWRCQFWADQGVVYDYKANITGHKGIQL